MARSDDLYSLPLGTPIPLNDGACDHLPGAQVPSIALPSTRGRQIILALQPGRTVVYIFPRTGRPGQNPLPGWNQTPGARGCTPQSCAFRDHHAELRALGVDVFGLSVQPTDYQQEAVERLHLPFELLSDEPFAFIRGLNLPEMEVAGKRFAQRVTLILRAGHVEHVFYPVFPPGENAEEVTSWLRAHQE
ncbi:MAG TPA: peroxiredoxin [Rhodothermales bacterium]|nr:peroxiredoxin [Rhodothermales bacterium]